MATTLGERLRAAREKKNLKQVDVTRKTGINNKTLSGYEKGVSEPDLETLKKLANEYEVDVNYLLGIPNKDHALYDPRAEELFKDLYALPKERREKYLNIMKMMIDEAKRPHTD